MRTRTVLSVIGACLALTLATVDAGGRTPPNEEPGRNGNGNGMNGMQEQTLSGTVTTIEEQDSLLVIQENGEMDTIFVDENTQIMRNGDTLELGDLEENTDVTVQYEEQNGRKTATEIREGEAMNGERENGEHENGRRPEDQENGQRDGQEWPEDNGEPNGTPPGGGQQR